VEPAADWLVDSSPPSPQEANGRPDVTPPAPDQLDYALVRLARAVGGERLSDKSAGSPVRGWLRVPEAKPLFTADMPVAIAQHRQGEPLKLAVDSHALISADATRVRYRTHTEYGASGSPVFNRDWELIAMHQMSEPVFDRPPAWNQGIPIDAIRALLGQRGKAGELGGEPPDYPPASG
jgi:Trypsin-like peptidase domain